MRSREAITEEVGVLRLEGAESYDDGDSELKGIALLQLEVLLDVRDLLQRSENRIGQFVADFPTLQPNQKHRVITIQAPPETD
jgi:hypothetical protein